MSLGGIIGGVVGGVIGFFVGGPMGAIYGASLGFGAGMMIDPIVPDMPSVGAPVPENEVMTSTIGDPCPDLTGTAKIIGHLLCYGAERTEAIYVEPAGGGKGGAPEPEAQVSGYNYYMSWVLGIVKGPVDTLYAVYKNEDIVWEGALDIPVSGGQETITLEGMGSCTFYFGSADQVANSKVGALLDDDTLNTPYRNYCWAFMDDCLIGNYPRTPTMAFITKKIPKYAFSAKHTIQDYDCNAAHSLYYVLNSMASLPVSWLDSTDFAALATTLYSEYRGVSVLFRDQQSTLNYIQMINYHIDNLLRYGADGKFHPKLIRNDYDVDTIPEINEDTMLDDPSLVRKSWIDTLNEIKVQYSEIIEVERPKVAIGKVYGAGIGTSGRLSTGNYNQQNYFTISQSTNLWKVVTCGHAHTLAIDQDDFLWGCGYALWGSWGLYPVPADTSIFNKINDTKWASVSGGKISTMAIALDGTLWGTGINTNGELGLGDTSTRYEFTQVGTDSDWAKVVCGNEFTLAIKTNGTLWGAGANGAGQLGLWDTNGRYLFTQIGIHPSDPPSLATGWTDIAGGSNSTYVIRGTELWVTGGNFYGQLGLGSGGSAQYSNLQPVSGVWHSVFCSSSSHAFAVSGSTLYGVGRGTDGQLGLGDSLSKNVFTSIGFQIKDAATGAYSSVLIDLDNKIWVTGQNNFGELALGDVITRTSWTKVDDNNWVDVMKGDYHMIGIKE